MLFGSEHRIENSRPLSVQYKEAINPRQYSNATNLGFLLGIRLKVDYKLFFVKMVLTCDD